MNLDVNFLFNSCNINVPDFEEKYYEDSNLSSIKTQGKVTLLNCNIDGEVNVDGDVFASDTTFSANTTVSGNIIIEKNSYSEHSIEAHDIIIKNSCVNSIKGHDIKLTDSSCALAEAAYRMEIENSEIAGNLKANDSIYLKNSNCIGLESNGHITAIDCKTIGSILSKGTVYLQECPNITGDVVANSGVIENSKIYGSFTCSSSNLVIKNSYIKTLIIPSCTLTLQDSIVDHLHFKDGKGELVLNGDSKITNGKDKNKIRRSETAIMQDLQEKIKSLLKYEKKPDNFNEEVVKYLAEITGAKVVFNDNHGNNIVIVDFCENDEIQILDLFVFVSKYLEISMFINLMIKGNGILNNIEKYKDKVVSLELHDCDCEHIPFSSLKFLRISYTNCENLTIPVKMLDLVKINSCDNITMLKVPKNLSFLEIRDCKNLEQIDFSDSDVLESFSMGNCHLLKSIEFPKSLRKLTMFKCDNLIEMDFTGCDKLYKFDVNGLSQDQISKFLYQNSRKNLPSCFRLLPSLKFASFEEKCIMLVELLTGGCIFENDDPQSEMIKALKTKLEVLKFGLSNGISTLRELYALTGFIHSNSTQLRLNQQSDFFREVGHVLENLQFKGILNPFEIGLKLKQLYLKPCNKIYSLINFSKLQEIAKGSIIKRENLPQNATLEAFDEIVASINKVFKDDPHGAKKTLEEFGISIDVLNIPAAYLRHLLTLTEETVSEVEAKWRAVLSNILNIKTHPGKYFNERIEAFIRTLMGIQHCENGKDIGIALSYSQLDPSYHYPVVLSKPQTEKEIFEQKKFLEGKKFIREFLNKWEKTPLGATATAFVVHVNSNLNEHSQNICLMIPEEQYWTEDFKLTKEGALELLRIVLMEDLEQQIAKVIQKMIESYFSGTDELMQELTGVKDVANGAHQALYLKNLIGHLVGLNTCVIPDLYSRVLYQKLVERDRSEVFRIFLKYVTPKKFVSAIMDVVNANATENKIVLFPILKHEAHWDENGKLTEKGASHLLEHLGYFT